MAQNLFERLLTALDASDENRWFEAVTQVSNDFGFDRILIGIRSGLCTRLEDAAVRTTYPECWRDKYLSEGWAYIDPVVSHCMTHVVPMVWKSEIFATNAQKQMYEEAQAYGIRSGVSLPVSGAGEERGLICLVSDHQPTPAFRRDVEALLPNLVLFRDVIVESALRQLGGRSIRELPHLTRRERECLEWAAIGKSAWEISMILKCSEAVVNFHLANVRRKFNVNSRQAAVTIATQLGIIRPYNIASKLR